MSAHDFGLMDALHGGPGSMDSWLEVHGENEICVAILAAIENAERPTKRDQFAAMITQALIGRGSNDSPEEMASSAMTYTNALLAELAKEQTP